MEKISFVPQPHYYYLSPREDNHCIEMTVEVMSYLRFITEILVNVYVVATGFDYFTLSDPEGLAIVVVAVVYMSLFLFVSVYHIILIQYIHNHDSVTLKEFDKISIAFATGLVVELIVLMGISMLTYYVIYVVQYQPAYQIMVQIQLIMLGKALLHIIHYTLFKQIRHQYDPVVKILIPIAYV